MFIVTEYAALKHPVKFLCIIKYIKFNFLSLNKLFTDSFALSDKPLNTARSDSYNAHDHKLISQGTERSQLYEAGVKPGPLSLKGKI